MNNELQNLINKQNEQIQQLLEVNSELMSNNQKLSEQLNLLKEQLDSLSKLRNYIIETLDENF
ncbi:Cell division protein FtsK [Enhydrobacter sp. 8BJ]|nr:Cell division protein FtsK [Enhydrobacter sp. 8BJ]